MWQDNKSMEYEEPKVATEVNPFGYFKPAEGMLPLIQEGGSGKIRSDA